MQPNYLDIKIQSWARYKNIIVVGPCRSGSTFFSQYIGSKLNCITIDEEVHRYKDSIFKYLLNAKFKKVIQSPGYLCTSHLFSDSDTLYVIMIRDIKDIIRSSKRINNEVSHIGFERVYARYKKYVGDKFIKQHKPKTLAFGESAKFRYKIWNEYQKHKTKNYVEIEYTELENADAYISKKERSKFTKKQTSKDNKSETFLFKFKNKILYISLLIIATLLNYKD